MVPWIVNPTPQPEALYVLRLAAPTQKNCSRPSHVRGIHYPGIHFLTWLCQLSRCRGRVAWTDLFYHRHGHRLPDLTPAYYAQLGPCIRPVNA